MEFFKVPLEETSEDLLCMDKEVSETKILCRTPNTSKISLLPKGGELAFLTNFRPVSILGSVYKIIAKILANRMIPFLPSWIRNSQTAFVPGRCIFDNIFMAQSAMDWAVESNQPLIILLLDLEKAYDRVSWTFLQQTMLHIGFPQEWIDLVMSLCNDASARVLLNEYPVEQFSLQRSVRQGCPLAPYLYLLAGDVLGHMLDDPNKLLKGLTLPDGRTTNNQMYADDTALYIQGNEANLNTAMNILTLYCVESGAKLNWRKSVGIWASPHPRTWQWTRNPGLKWLPQGTSIRYLGFSIGSMLPSPSPN